MVVDLDGDGVVDVGVSRVRIKEQDRTSLTHSLPMGTVSTWTTCELEAVETVRAVGDGLNLNEFGQSDTCGRAALLGRARA